MSAARQASVIELDMLIDGVRAAPQWTEAVECRYAKSRGEIAVRPAASRPLRQLVREFARHGPCVLVEPDYIRRAFERRSIDAAADLQARAWEVRFQGVKRLLDCLGILHR